MIVSEILNVTEKAFQDNSIVYAEKHTHQPYSSTTFNNNDEIRIPILHQDVYTFPSKSVVCFEGKLVKEEGGVPTTTGKFVNFGISHLLDEIRYELNGAVVDRVRNVGITATMKAYVSYNSNQSIRLENAGWSPTKDEISALIDASGNFMIYVPAEMLMGVFEDFKKILINVRQELVIVRSSHDVNAVINSDATEKLKVNLTKVYWRVPHISVADVNRLKLLKHIEHGSQLEMNFRSWELHEYPILQQTKRHTWAIKNATQVETPRYIIVGFQTDRKNKLTKNMSKFDSCDLRNITLYLNSERYPYDNLNLDFSNNKIAHLYEMYADFQSSYYERDNQPVLSPADFKSRAPLAVIDCSRQNETLKGGAVDIRLEFETNTDVAANTTAYALILFDRKVKYNPFNSDIKVIN